MEPKPPDFQFGLHAILIRFPSFWPWPENPWAQTHISAVWAHFSALSVPLDRKRQGPKTHFNRVGPIFVPALFRQKEKERAQTAIFSIWAQFFIQI